MENNGEVLFRFYYAQSKRSLVVVPESKCSVCCDYAGFIIHYSFRASIIFSATFKPRLISPPSTPNPPVIDRRLLMSDFVIERVNSMVGAKIAMKITVPNRRHIQLAKLSCDIIRYVKIAVSADERMIFAEERESTVTL